MTGTMQFCLQFPRKTIGYREISLLDVLDV